ncbi:hypothetical protein D3C71_1564890 [compost metagenome]
MDQGGLVDHAAACHVDEKALWAQGMQHLAVDHVARGRAASHCKDEVVRPRGQIDHRVEILEGGVSGGAAVVIAHLHAKPVGPFGHGLADAAHAHNAQAFAADLGLWCITGFGPFAAAYKAVTGGHTT